MTLRLKHLLRLGAAAAAVVGLAPGAIAAGFTAFSTQTYSAQTVALSPGGNTAIVPLRTLTYTSTSGLYAGDTITWTTTGNGTTFAGTAVATAACNTLVAPTAAAGGGCLGSNLTVAIAGNTLTVTVGSTFLPIPVPPAPNVFAIPAGAAITLSSCGPTLNIAGVGGVITLASTGAPACPNPQSTAGGGVLASGGAPIPLSQLTVTGLTNLASAAAATAGVGPSTVFGTIVPAVPGTVGPPQVNTTPLFGQSSTGVATLGDMITVQARQGTCPAGASCPVVTADPNPLANEYLNSANSFAVAPGGGALQIDLSGGPTGTVIPGTQFRNTTAASAGTTPTVSLAGLLGTLLYSNSAGLLDARNGVACCSATTSGIDVNGAVTAQTNTPLTSTATVVLTGDFQTIAAAYLRPGNNVNAPVAGATQNTVGGTLANGASGAAGPEQAPSAISTCTATSGATDILSTTAGAGTGTPAGPGFSTLTFTIPSSANVVNGAFVNQLTYGICVVTNGTNIIPDTFGNNPAGGTIGAAGAGVRWSVQVTVPGIANPIGLIAQSAGIPGFDITYAGSKFIFPTVFPNANTGPSGPNGGIHQTWFRLVNTGMGTVNFYAILIKDAQPGLASTRTPLQAANATPIAQIGPFGAVFVRADDIATALGTTLGSFSTITLLSPAAAGSVLVSRWGNEPGGTYLITGPGI